MPALDRLAYPHREDAMNPRRYRALDEAGTGLLPAEIDAGWHFCEDWDGMLIGPRSPEMENCLCSRKLPPRFRWRNLMPWKFYSWSLYRRCVLCGVEQVYKRRLGWQDTWPIRFKPECAHSRAPWPRIRLVFWIVVGVVSSVGPFLWKGLMALLS